MSLREIVVTNLSGVGPKIAEKLARCNISTVQDLLFHMPLHYQDRTTVKMIAELRVGDHALLDGMIIKSEIKYGKRRSLVCQLEDETGRIGLRFFYFNAAQQQGLAIGKRVRCFGEVKQYPKLEMVHPEYQVVQEEIQLDVEESLTPIYPTTEGLNQNTWRKLIKQALHLLVAGEDLDELLPESILENVTKTELKQAILFIHQPPPTAEVSLLENGTHPMQQRLAFEELLAHHLSLRLVHKRLQQRQAIRLDINKNSLRQAFIKQLPFQLTAAQQRVVSEITKDLAQSYPMSRLVQGDVGCGKTVVSALAILHALENNLQAVMMAPTEILAEQHYQSFSNWLEPLGINVAWLSGQVTGKSRQEVLSAIESGDAQVVIGTHAVFQKEVIYKNLALVVVDEQHRFGVEQRLALLQKGQFAGQHPHQLIMTATPIPRTLAMAFYADMDTSVIDELPPGRKPITTLAVPNSKREQIIARVLASCQEKHQTYWVCTLIDESESLQCQAAEVTAEELTTALPSINVGLVHGRLKSAEKDEVMQAFKAGDIDLLVATTVIEVGVDVPNASLMIIENPERLGLAQLHQLRGRVGRGGHESYCVLLYQNPLSKTAHERLAVLRDSCDGFVIAQRDLEIRGPGEVLGTRQTGAINFKIAELNRDKHLVSYVQDAANQLFAEHEEVIPKLIRRWLADSEKYSHI